MTTLYQDEIRCSQCRKLSEHEVIESAGSFGSSDLDIRPAEMMRSTLPQQVQCCPHCGYCMPSVSAPLPNVSTLLASAEYRQQLESKEYPELANRFLCSAMILESLGRLKDAGWACIHGAWACDDAGDIQPAKNCRLRAESAIGRAIINGQGTTDRPGFDFLILADLLRRAGEFERADQRLKEGFSPNCDQEVLFLLIFERLLINRRDTACHTVEEAIEASTRMCLEYSG
ncbi:MAG: hypothetical protein WCK27_28935 [Verrucomicrobiota bacterium]